MANESFYFLFIWKGGGIYKILCLKKNKFFLNESNSLWFSFFDLCYSRKKKNDTWNGGGWKSLLLLNCWLLFVNWGEVKNELFSCCCCWGTPWNNNGELFGVWMFWKRNGFELFIFFFFALNIFFFFFTIVFFLTVFLNIHLNFHIFTLFLNERNKIRCRK